MPRITRWLPEENRYALDPARIGLDPEGCVGDAVERLAAYENLFEHLHTRLREIPEELAALRAQGKEKTVTFRELAAQKLMYQAWIEMAEEYGAKG